MTFAISVGTYRLLNFAELQLRSLRNIFGYTTPIIIMDGASENSQRIKELADQFDCSFLTEKVNRGHWSGCINNAVCATAFARHVGADVVIKTNQRYLLLDDSIPERLEEVFDNPKISLATPPPFKAETIRDSGSKFHSKFLANPCLICMKSSDIEPEWIASAYAEQVKTDTSRHASLTEYFWHNQITNRFKNRFASLEWLATPTEPPLYLSKVQHSDADFQKAAIKLGMQPCSFETKEWPILLGSGYRPIPRAV